MMGTHTCRRKISKTKNYQTFEFRYIHTSYCASTRGVCRQVRNAEKTTKDSTTASNQYIASEVLARTADKSDCLDCLLKVHGFFCHNSVWQTLLRRQNFGTIYNSNHYIATRICKDLVTSTSDENPARERRFEKKEGNDRR